LLTEQCEFFINSHKDFPALSLASRQGPGEVPVDGEG
jgi:hypothetical protein